MDDLRFQMEEENAAKQCEIEELQGKLDSETARQTSSAEDEAARRALEAREDGLRREMDELAGMFIGEE